MILGASWSKLAIFYLCNFCHIWQETNQINQQILGPSQHFNHHVFQEQQGVILLVWTTDMEQAIRRFQGLMITETSSGTSTGSAIPNHTHHPLLIINSGREHPQIKCQWLSKLDNCGPENPWWQKQQKWPFVTKDGRSSDFSQDSMVIYFISIIYYYLFIKCIW